MIYPSSYGEQVNNNSIKSCPVFNTSYCTLKQSLGMSGSELIPAKPICEDHTVNKVTAQSAKNKWASFAWTTEQKLTGIFAPPSGPESPTQHRNKPGGQISFSPEGHHIGQHSA
jgi:hypothetical protein